MSDFLCNIASDISIRIAARNMALNFPTDAEIAAFYFSRIKMSFLVRQQKERETNAM